MDNGRWSVADRRFVALKALLHRLYVTDKLSTLAIARQFGSSKGTVRSLLVHHGIPRRSRSESAKLQPVRCGAKAGNWKGGRYRDAAGYVRVHAPGHPRAHRGSHVLEHILVWEQFHGRPLPLGYVIHHFNGLKDDNRLGNLIALPSRKHRFVIRALKDRILELEQTLTRIRTTEP